MKLESQVCSLDLAKRLKALGVKQESLFYYMNHLSNKDWSNQVRYPDGSDPRYWDFESKISAFTVAELGKMLPLFETGCSGREVRIRSKYIRQSWSFLKQRADTEADARAKMLIYLIEFGVIKP